MVLVNTHQFSDDELSAIHQLRSEGLTEVEVERLLKEYENQEWLDYEDVTLTEEPSKRGGPTRRRPGSRGKRQTLLQFLMKRLLARRKRRPRPQKGSRPRPQHRPQHRPRPGRPSYHKPKPSYPSASYDISQAPLKPFDQFTAPVAPSTPPATYQPTSPPTYQQTTTETVPEDVYYEPVTSTVSSYTTSPSSAPSFYDHPTTVHTSASSPTSYQNSEGNTKFRFPPFPFASIERDTFFNNFKSKF